MPTFKFENITIYFEMTVKAVEKEVRTFLRMIHTEYKGTETENVSFYFIL